MISKRNKTYVYFIGIDVSKLTLDFTVITEHQILFHKTIENSTHEISQFLKELKSIKGLTKHNSVFGMEQTGIYCNHLKAILEKLKVNFVVDNPLKIRNSFGIIRGKTDKLDSKRIADYLVKHRSSLRLWNPKRQIIQHLASLITLRTRLLNVKVSLKMPIAEEKGFLNRRITESNAELCLLSVQSLESDILNIDREILKLWTSDETINRKMNLILSVPSIGKLTALQMLVSTNEFLDITNPRSFACYCGVAPFAHESGTTIRKRTENSPIANRKMKTLLHICAISAIRWIPDIKEYYERKTQKEGKSKLMTINAVRFKLICRVYACIKENRMYRKEFKPKQLIPPTANCHYQLLSPIAVNKPIVFI